MIINKVIVGFVTQRFDTETRQFVGQEFVGSDDRQWENEMGEDVDPPDVDGDEPYLNMEMVQPVTEKFHIGQRVLVTPADDGSDPQNEFQGVVVGFKSNEFKGEQGTVAYKFVQVRDQEDNVFDCDFGQVAELK